MIKDSVSVSVVIPAKNEQDNVEPLIRQIVQTLAARVSFEIVYVDDGSNDQTYAELVRLLAAGVSQIVPLQLRYSVGQSTAIHTAVTYARGQLIVTMDADGQNDPADIPNLLEHAYLQPQGSDFCIAGYRKNRKDTPWKRFQSRIANKVRCRLLKDGTPDTGCGLKVFPRATFVKLPYFDHMHRFIPALVRRLGGKIVVVNVNHLDRQHGVSKYNMLGRLGVGLVDLFGVMWLQRRAKLVEVVCEPNEQI